MEERGLSVCLSVCNNREPCKNGWTDRDAVWDVDSDSWPKESWGPDPHTWRGSFEGEKGPAQNTSRTCPTIDIRKATQQGQNRYGADADCGVPGGAEQWHNLAMRPYVKLIWPLVFSIGCKVGYVSATDGYPGASACLNNPALNISCGRYYRDLGGLSTKVSPVITVG